MVNSWLTARRCVQLALGGLDLAETLAHDVGGHGDLVRPGRHPHSCRIAAPDDPQGGALDTLRAATAAAAEKLSSKCPQDVPAPAWARSSKG
jgi:hypothetical protein